MSKEKKRVDLHKTNQLFTEYIVNLDLQLPFNSLPTHKISTKCFQLMGISLTLKVHFGVY